MTFNDFIALPWMRWTVRLADWWENVRARITFLFRNKKDIMKIAVVGDLSMQAHDRLDRVLTAALANADLVVQVGDMHSAYDVIRKHMKSGRLLVIPGNHDDKYDSLGVKRQWIRKFPQCTLVGLDNANDRFNDETWQLVDQCSQATRPVLVFAHKPISTVVLSDGSENTHVMGENGDPRAKKEAEFLQSWLKAADDVLFICGHWHGLTYQKCTYGDVLVEGRGGAAPDLGYTLLTILPDGMVMHHFTLN